MFRTGENTATSASCRAGRTGGARRSGICARAAILSLAVAFLAAAAPQASAQTLTAAECQTAFEGSPANTHCSNAGGFHLTDADADSGERRCYTRRVCGISVRVGGTERIFRHFIFAEQTFTLAEVGSLDLCFSRDENTTEELINLYRGWRMTVSAGCGDATDSATAVSDGLSLDEE